MSDGDYPLTGSRWGVIRQPDGEKAWLVNRQTGRYEMEGSRERVFDEAVRRAKADAAEDSKNDPHPAEVVR